MRIARLTGSIYDQIRSEDVLKKIVEAGACNAAVASREIVIEVPFDRLEEIKDMLRRFKVTDIKVRETKLVETTVTQAGIGKDPDDTVRVSLAPAARVVGQRLMKVTLDGRIKSSGDTKEELAQIYSRFVRYVLQKAGVSDVIYSIEVLKKKSEEEMERALELATISAILNANGIIQINA